MSGPEEHGGGVPEDIRETAEEIASIVDSEAPPVTFRSNVDIIAAALMAERLAATAAERERCWPKMHTDHPCALVGARALRDTGMETNQIARAIAVFEAIAAAIRNQRQENEGE